MFNTGKQDKSRSHQDNTPQENLSHGAHSSVEQSDNTSWQTVDFPGTIAVDQIPGPVSHLRTNAMDSSSTPSIKGTPGGTHPRETELLNLVRDLNECNDVLLTKVSQLEESLERSQAALQAEILDSACRLVRPGGRLVYATCSLLHRENEEQVAKFQSAHDDFSIVPIRQAWSSVFGENAPDLELAEEVETLTLTPARHGTDGFFVAVMERAKEPEAAASDIADAAH